MQVNISEDILTDVLTHHGTWRKLLVRACTTCDNPESSSEEADGDKSYWQHELRVFDRLHAEVERVLRPDQYQKRIELSSGKSAEQQEHDARQAKIVRPQLTVHVDDTICLAAISETALSMLRVWGVWWKIKSGYGNRGDHWLLQSIAKQPRERKPKDVQVLAIHKTEDPQYVVTKVVAFPEEFNYKKHHQ